VTAAPLSVETHAFLDGPGSSPVSEWPERIALTFGLLLFVAVAVWGLWRGLRGHRRRQVDVGPLPVPPADLGNALAGPFDGRYVATTLAEDREPIVSQGLGRAGVALLAVTDAGVYVERTGTAGLFLPSGALRCAHVERTDASSVFGEGSLVVISWVHGRFQLDTGFRAEAPRRHLDAVDAVGRVVARTAARPTSSGTTEATS